MGLKKDKQPIDLWQALVSFSQFKIAEHTISNTKSDNLPNN
jgi:hypothetical protein